MRKWCNGWNTELSVSAEPHPLLFHDLLLHINLMKSWSIFRLEFIHNIISGVLVLISSLPVGKRLRRTTIATIGDPLLRLEEMAECLRQQWPFLTITTGLFVSHRFKLLQLGFACTFRCSSAKRHAVLKGLLWLSGVILEEVLRVELEHILVFFLEVWDQALCCLRLQLHSTIRYFVVLHFLKGLIDFHYFLHPYVVLELLNLLVRRLGLWVDFVS